jgi:hypothetical protein
MERFRIYKETKIDNQINDRCTKTERNVWCFSSTRVQ